MKKIALLLMSFLLATPVFAQERILLFHSDIQIQSDASMIVTETIRVHAEGREIRRGIYREFPTRYRDRYGNRVVVDFEVLSVSKNGEPEIFSVASRANGVRVDFGGDELLAVPAQYEYTLTYRTRRQIGYFDSHDELYWNVTGLGWSFWIEQASADVQLPQALPVEALTMEGYTGPLGASDQYYQATLAAGQGHISTTVALPPGHGLTLAMTFPKGIVAQPGAWQRLSYLLADNIGVLLALVALMGCFVWLLLAWQRVGRDPQKGVIFAQYQPPDGLSPASARYLMQMGYDTKTFTAAVVNLAVKGYVKILQSGDEFTLQKRESTKTLASGEQALLSRLFATAPVLELKNHNHATVSAAMSAHKAVLDKDYLTILFHNNGRYLLPSIVGFVLVMLLILMLGAFVPVIVLVMLMAIVMHAVFAWLLKAPTVDGRKLMDVLEGFRLYLETAEKDDLNRAHPPALTLNVFEKFLPYAIALGVEQAWAKQFEQVFASLEQRSGVRYQPLWYAGSFSLMRMTDFGSNLGSTMNAAISSASTPPGSSSGAGGGGFSGGGGGGGGGGGR